MDWFPWLLGALLAVPAFFAWAALHEVSHYLVARALRRVLSVDFKLWPHVVPEAGFRWAAVSWDYEGPDLTPREDALISAAPRLPDLLAVLLTPVAAAMPEPWLASSWAVLVGAGLVDLAVGSVGAGELSDLRRVARGAGIPAWALRLAGWAAVLVSAGTTIGLLVWRWA